MRRSLRSRLVQFAAILVASIAGAVAAPPDRALLGDGTLGCEAVPLPLQPQPSGLLNFRGYENNPTECI